MEKLFILIVLGTWYWTHMWSIFEIFYGIRVDPTRKTVQDYAVGG